MTVTAPQFIVVGLLNPNQPLALPVKSLMNSNYIKCLIPNKIETGMQVTLLSLSDGREMMVNNTIDDLMRKLLPEE